MYEERDMRLFTKKGNDGRLWVQTPRGGGKMHPHAR